VPRRGRRATPTRRYAVVYDIEGPRVRLGIAWFAVVVAALVAGTFALAFVYAVTAAIAAAQTARAWRRKRARPSEPMAALGAGMAVAGAILGAGGVGIGVLALVALAFWWSANDHRSRNPQIVDVAMTVRCALPVGLAAASVLLAHRLEPWAAVALVLLVSSYEVGDFIIGSGGRSALEGPVAGVAVIVVMAFLIGITGVPPFDMRSAFAFGALAAVLCPAGQLAASAILPAAGAPASALRRLDSLLLLAPAWAWLVGIHMQGLD
jgi:hypothetical protein